MAVIHRRRAWQLPGLIDTTESSGEWWIKLDRRNFMQSLICGGAAAIFTSDGNETAASSLQDKKKKEAGSQVFPAPRNESYKVEGKLTDEMAAARYNNFYEF